MTAQRKSSAANRVGPRPLGLHLALQSLTWLSSRNALPFLKAGLQPWSPELAGEAEALAKELAAADPRELEAAIDAEAAARFARFLDGVAAYRAHPARRVEDDIPVVWSEGTTRVLDYGTKAGKKKGGAPVLVVPSLINRFYVLDLAPDRSLLRHLAAAGLRPFVVVWVAPGETERGYDLTDYVAGRLERALDRVTAETGRSAAVIGYCMGGLLALALAARRPADVSALALLATPWDFATLPDAKRRSLSLMMPGLEMMMNNFGVLPVDVQQALFASLDPWMTVRKFRRFAPRDDQPGAADSLFVALEDWLNDGVPLSTPVARETLSGWYLENLPGRGDWRIGDLAIRPAEVRQPALVMIPARDHIVPPESAWPLAEALPRADSRAIAAGHIGMVAGSRGAELVHAPLADWLLKTAR
jgi:polyhydroxyalkanoate synthase